MNFNRLQTPALDLQSGEHPVLLGHCALPNESGHRPPGPIARAARNAPSAAMGQVSRDRVVIVAWVVSAATANVQIRMSPLL